MRRNTRAHPLLRVADDDGRLGGSAVGKGDGVGLHNGEAFHLRHRHVQVDDDLPAARPCRVSHQLSGQVSLSCVMVWKSGRSALAAVRPLTASARQVHMQSIRLFIRFPPVCRFHQVCGDAPKARQGARFGCCLFRLRSGRLFMKSSFFLRRAGLPHIKAWREGLSAAHAITGKLPAGAVWFNPPLILPPFNKSSTVGLTHPPYTFIRTKNQGGK